MRWLGVTLSGTPVSPCCVYILYSIYIHLSLVWSLVTNAHRHTRAHSDVVPLGVCVCVCNLRAGASRL